MAKEIRIKHDDISTPQSITPHMEKEFKARDWDIHQHEVEKMEDDFKTGERILHVKHTKYFPIGGDCSQSRWDKMFGK